MSRFNLKTNYHFIRFLVSGAHPMGGELKETITSISPWLYQGSHNVPEFKTLTCVEHHKVPNEFDPKEEPTCDGFRFVCPQEKGNVTFWNNQYPTASYGQMSDTADRVVTSASYKEDGKTIDDILEFYRLDSTLSSMWKLIAKGENKEEHVKEKIQAIFKEVDVYLEQEDIGIKISKKDLEKCSLISLEICKANDETISASQLLEIPWEDSWF
tara:strand:+ start:1753 stop:2391 length:639 start_codon:yes stop_codon:yes gene_type:complete